MPSAWFWLLIHNAAPPSLHGVREGPFPRFHTTMERSDSPPLVAPGFVAFAKAIPPVRLVCSQRPKARGRGLRGVDVPVPEPENDGGNGRVSQVPGHP
jgi:hypothetical protein